MAKKTKGSGALVPDVMPVESPDVALVREDGTALSSFVQNVRAFFQTATELEVAAKDALVYAKGLALPTNGQEDLLVQTFIKAANADKKAVEAHWEITTLASRFHKRLVERRKAATTPLEEAATIANALHNRYVEAERRRVAAEEERLRQVAEAEARQRRQEELDRLEAEAALAEANAPTLSEREQTAVDLFIINRDPVQAIRRAGFKMPTFEQAEAFFRRAKIVAAITAKQEAAAMRQQAVGVKHLPLEIEEPEPVLPDVGRISNASERTTWRGECFDEAKFIAAALSGQHGIPADCLTVNQGALTSWAQQLHEKMNAWPGVRAVSTTRLV